MIKRLSALSILTVVLLFFTACAAGSNAGSAGKSAAADKNKVLRVVDDATYPPFETLNQGKVEGFDVDLMQALAKAAGYKYQLVNVGWDPMFAELRSNTADMAISALSMSPDREKSYDFSKPYYQSTTEIIAPKDSSIKSAQDLKGKVVAVQQGTTSLEALEKVVGKNNPNVKKFKTTNLAILEMLNHGADAAVADNGVLDYYVQKNPGKNLKTVSDAKGFASEYYGLMYPKNSKLKPVFDKAINQVLNDGTYAKIYKKWFGKEPDLKQLKAQQ